MTELMLDIDAIPSYLNITLRSKKFIVRQANQVITITPADEAETEKNYSCPFLGIAADSNLTVDKFLQWKREERDAEY